MSKNPLQCAETSWQTTSAAWQPSWNGTVFHKTEDLTEICYRNVLHILKKIIGMIHWKTNYFVFHSMASNQECLITCWINLQFFLQFWSESWTPNKKSPGTTTYYSLIFPTHHNCSIPVCYLPFSLSAQHFTACEMSPYVPFAAWLSHH